MMNHNKEQKRANLYILAGQSNMDGQGFVSDLPDRLTDSRNDAWIYSPNRRDDQQPIDEHGFWDELKPGFGEGFRTDGTRNIHSDRFGPELTFAERIGELSPETPILIYKYAKGGSSIHPDAATDWGCWDPEYERGNGINQWTHFQFHLHRSVELANKRFGSAIPAGIVWHQGESDASHTRGIAEAYQKNLATVVNRMRQELGDMTLPVVVGQISDSMLGRGKRQSTYPFGELVQFAQREFVTNDAYAAVVTAPKNHGFIDAWHYDSQTYIDLGIRFADAMIDLEIGKTVPK